VTIPSWSLRGTISESRRFPGLFGPGNHDPSRLMCHGSLSQSRMIKVLYNYLPVRRVTACGLKGRMPIHRDALGQASPAPHTRPVHPVGLSLPPSAPPLCAVCWAVKRKGNGRNTGKFETSAGASYGAVLPADRRHHISP